VDDGSTTTVPCGVRQFRYRSPCGSTDRVVEIEFSLGIVTLFQAPQLFQPPWLVPVQFLPRFVTGCIVDIGVQWTPGGVSGVEERSSLTAVAECYLIEARVGVEGSE